METYKPTSTPSKPHTQILADEVSLLSDLSHYMSIVGALQYLTFTTPDLAHFVNMVCQHMTQPTDVHFHSGKRILRYVQGTINYGLHYTKRPKFQVTAYLDFDWAVDINTRRLISSFVVCVCVYIYIYIYISGIQSNLMAFKEATNCLKNFNRS